MRSARLRAAPSSFIALAVTLAVAATAAGQSPAPEPGPSCAMLTADEANAVFSGANLALNENSGGYYCSLGGAFDLTISVMPETPLDDVKVNYGDGKDVTVAGQPGWWQEASGNLAVAKNGSVLFMNGWNSAEESEGQLKLLSNLAELIVPRIPPGAGPAVVARLKALLSSPGVAAPGVFSVLPGWFLLPDDGAPTPERKRLFDQLASQGRTFDDLVLVVVGAGSESTFAAEVPGLPGAALLLPLLYVIDPAAATAPVSADLLGLFGPIRTIIETEPPWFAFAKDDSVVYAHGSGAVLASPSPTPAG